MNRIGKDIEDIKTVGQLIDALNSWDRDAKVLGPFEGEINIREILDYDNKELVYLEITEL